MRFVRILSGLLVFALALCLLPLGSAEVKAATTVVHQANDTTETVLTVYDVQENNVDNQKGYSTLQTGKDMAQDGFLDKNNGLSVTWTVQADEAGYYTFDPYYYIGHFGSMSDGIYNMVWCVNDTRYYLGNDITSTETETLKVLHGDDVVELYLDKGVNIVRMLPVAGPHYVYQKVEHVKSDGTTCTAASYINIYKVGIDSRLTVRQAAPLTVSFETADRNNSEFNYNQFSSGTADSGFLQSGQTFIKTNYATMPDYDTLCQSNLSQIPYVSYSLNAPEDGWYDMTMNLSLASVGVYGNDGYLIIRVNGTNYKRWVRVCKTTNPNNTAAKWDFCDQNISVPLKKGDNSVTVTCAVGLKGGSNASNCEVIAGGYGVYTRIKKLTVYGGVTLASAKIDPTTVADAPKSSTKLEAETYGTGWNYTASGTKMVSGDLSGVTGLPTLYSLWNGEWLDKAAVPHVSFTVDVPTAGTYTVRSVYTLTPASGADALDYYMTGSANDSFYDKARFEPLTALSRTVGYSELTLELEAGVNVIRLLPVLDGNPAGALDMDYIQIIGGSTVTGLAPQVTALRSAEAQYQNAFTASGDLLTGSTGDVAAYAALNGANIKKTGWFAYTVNVPKAGCYDLYVNVGSGGTGAGSMVLVLDGKKLEIPVALGRAVENNPVNLSRYLTAGEHTLLITGVLGQESTMGALTVSGGITAAATQVDPLSLGVLPAVKEGGLVLGSVYSESNYQISGVPANTTALEFKSNFLAGSGAAVVDAGGDVMADTAAVTAGCGILYPNGTYYQIAALSQSAKRSMGADYVLEMCNPVGRLVEHQDALLMELSASNFTMTGDLSGDITLTVTVDKKRLDYDLHTLFVEVDGTASYYELVEGQQTVTVAKDLASGSHTVKISKGTEAYRQDMYIHSVTYTGTLQTAQAAARRIEFLGDSITAGSGVFFEDCGFGATHSYFSYANMTADALGADYYSVANGGWRFSTSVTQSSSIYNIYPYVSMHMQDTLGEYDHSWEPDVIVINLGTNDAIASRNNTAYSQEVFQTDVTAMLQLVRDRNPNAHIIWAYGMMIKERLDWIKAPVEAFAATDDKVHWVEQDGNSLGRGNHPDFTGSTLASGMLVEAICEIMGWELPTDTHATGDCGGAASCDFCRHNELTLALHTYDDACDTDCNSEVCNHKRTAPHYSADCTKTTCDLCGAAREALESHSYANACDEYCDNPDCANRRNGIAHSFMEDACTVCGITRIEPDFTGASVTMYNDLSLNFKVDATRLGNHGYEGTYAVFTCNGHSITVSEGVQNGDTLAFTFPGIAPHRLGDTVTATLYTTLDGETVSQTAEYSVADYCYNMLEKCTGDEYQELRTLLVDMLNYGAAAQNFTSYKPDALVTADLTEEHLEYATTGTPVLNDIKNTTHVTVSDPQVTWKGAGLYLKDAVVVRLKFSAEDTEGLTVTMELGDAKYNLDESDFVSAGGENLYYVYFEQLNAAQMREVFDVTFYRDGNAVSNTLRYSIESYIYSKQGSSDANLAALVTALIRYGDAACAFVN